MDDHPVKVSSSKNMIGFFDLANTNWTAGMTYYENLFRALRSLPRNQQPALAILRRPDTKKTGYEQYQALVDQEISIPVQPAVPSRAFLKRQQHRLVKKLGISPPPPAGESYLSRFLRDRNVAVAFASFSEFGPNFKIPLLSWIHDFQDLHFPELFRLADLRARERAMQQIAKNATRVILSSNDARKDFLTFAPAEADKVRVMHFVAHLPAFIYKDYPAWICSEYHLPREFVFLPNQFWRHKNHTLVLDALALLRESHSQIRVVCSGNPNDFRASLYFGELLAKISRLGLREQFIILGWIPHAHMFHLMRQALVVLQPSLFEGWSTTVEETKSLGKTLILSDIPVHREQNPRSVYWFDPRDPRALADCLVRAFDEKTAGPDTALENSARAEFPNRVQEFGRTFMQIADEVLAA